VPFEPLVYKQCNLFIQTEEKNYNEIKIEKKETIYIGKKEIIRVAKKYGWSNMEAKVRRKLGFEDEYSDYVPDEFTNFVKRLKEAIPIWKGFYKVMNRVWQDVCTTGIKYMEESQLQDMISSFIYHTLMHLINNLGRWDISFDFMDRNTELNLVASVAV
jgi:hypothetical protein